MTPNTLVVRNLVVVLVATGLATVSGLALARRLEPTPPASYVPPNRVAGPPTAKQGRDVFEAKGCIACHTADGSPRVGPSFAHRWGTQVALADGSHVTFDEAYVRDSLAFPQSKAQPG